MPLAALLGNEPMELRASRLLRRVRPATVLIGVRNPTNARRPRCANPASVFTMKDIQKRHGVDCRAGRCPRGRGTAGIHVSFDMTSATRSVAPGVGTPVKGGSITAKRTLREIVADSNLRAPDLVEVNPTLDAVRDRTARN